MPKQSALMVTGCRPQPDWTEGFRHEACTIDTLDWPGVWNHYCEWGTLLPAPHATGSNRSLMGTYSISSDVLPKAAFNLRIYPVTAPGNEEFIVAELKSNLIN